MFVVRIRVVAGVSTGLLISVVVILVYDRA